MEEHFLRACVSGSSTFAPEPWYNPYGDCVVYQCVPEARIAERVDGILTLYRSAIDRRVIGFQIKGVQAIMEKFDFDALALRSTEHEGRIVRIAVVMLVLAAVTVSPEPRTVDSLRAYHEAVGVAERSDAVVEIGQPVGV